MNHSQSYVKFNKPKTETNHSFYCLPLTTSKISLKFRNVYIDYTTGFYLTKPHDLLESKTPDLYKGGRQMF